jgi:hypothetical protein
MFYKNMNSWNNYIILFYINENTVI